MTYHYIREFYKTKKEGKSTTVSRMLFRYFICWWNTGYIYHLFQYTIFQFICVTLFPGFFAFVPKWNITYWTRWNASLHDIALQPLWRYRCCTGVAGIIIIYIGASHYVVHDVAARAPSCPRITISQQEGHGAGVHRDLTRFKRESRFTWQWLNVMIHDGANVRSRRLFIKEAMNMHASSRTRQQHWGNMFRNWN